MSQRHIVHEGNRFVHPIYVPPVTPFKDGQSAIPASTLRNVLGWPEEAISQAAKDADPTFEQCVAERGARRCPCGAYELTWR